MLGQLQQLQQEGTTMIGGISRRKLIMIRNISIDSSKITPKREHKWTNNEKNRWIMKIIIIIFLSITARILVVELMESRIRCRIVICLVSMADWTYPATIKRCFNAAKIILTMCTWISRNSSSGNGSFLIKVLF